MSLGKAAKLANVSRVEFSEYLSALGVAIVDYCPSELDAEMDYFEEWPQDLAPRIVNSREKALFVAGLGSFAFDYLEMLYENVDTKL